VIGDRLGHGFDAPRPILSNQRQYQIDHSDSIRPVRSSTVGLGLGLGALGALGALLIVSAGPATARADNKAKTVSVDTPVDVADVKSKLKVLTDGKKHFVAVVPFGPTEHFYYGDGKAFYAQRVFGSGSSGQESFDLTFWEPRVRAPYQASFEFRDGKYRVQCDERKTELSPLPDDEAKTLLDTARFFRPRWKQRAHALARDDRGIYYYVDRGRESDDSKTFRLFAGPKGIMKPLKMVNVVSDSEGEIFSTPSGELRLVLDRKQTVWIQKKRRIPLSSLPVEDNHVLIYSDLGVYAGQRLGTPCDDL
jgi:hypothetical protein